MSLIRVREDKALRRKKKQILEDFNARRAVLKQNIAAQRPPRPIDEARLRTKAKKQAEMGDTSDDGFRNYEENKSRLDTHEIPVKAEEAPEDNSNVRAVEAEQQVNTMKEESQQFKAARDQTKDLLTMQPKLLKKSLDHYSAALSDSATRLEQKYVDMDLIQKPQTVKVKTALERELARLRGYGSGGTLMTGNIVDEFGEVLDQQKEQRSKMATSVQPSAPQSMS